MTVLAAPRVEAPLRVRRIRRGVFPARPRAALTLALFLLAASGFFPHAAVFAADEPAAPAPGLACPVIESAQSEEKAAPPAGGGKTLPAVRVNSLSIESKIRDGNPLFYPANADAQPGEGKPYAVLKGPPGIEELSFDELMALSTERIGVAADGASQLVLQLRATVPGTFKAAVMADGDENGEIWFLRDGETCDTGDGHVAFAVFAAPADFGKRTGSGEVKERVGRAEARTAAVTVSFTPAGSERHLHEVVDIKLVRPPVVLVHGLFDNAIDAWLTPYDVLPAKGWMEWMRAKLDFLAPSGDFGTLPGILDAAGFETFLVDFSASNGRGGEPSSFQDNRYVVWTDGTAGFLGAGHPTYKNNETGQEAHTGGIRRALAYFRENLNIAAARADVIGHSMGGVIARAYAADKLPEAVAADKNCKVEGPYNPEYRRPDNFNLGDINRLITLNTPHNGSGQTALFELLTQDAVEKEGILSWTARSASKYYALIAQSVKAGSPAMQDLRLESCALRRIGETQVPSHLFVAATRAGGQKDPVQDPAEDYYTTLKYVSAILYYFPEVLDKFVADILPDWQGTDWAGAFPAEILATLQDLIDLEADYWVQLRDTQAGKEWWRPGSEPEREELVPYVTMEALRALMFRFDGNDSTVRVDSQLGGLDLDSDYVTYAAASKEPHVDIQQSMLHRFTPRERAIQVSVVGLLRSGFDKFAPSLPPAGAHMPGKAPPAGFAVDWQITGNDAIAWSGLVFSHADVLRDFAAENKVVIMTRPVNPDATALIGQLGAATKGMNIKGKSSNWGPQRGYLPADQRYSKLWRIFSGKTRDEKIQEFSKKTKELLAAKKPEYRTESGEPLAVDRQLMHCWPPPCPAAGESGVGTAVYTVWEDPEELDAEAAVYFCKGRPANGDTEKTDAARNAAVRPCDCTAWLDWRNGDANKKDLTASGEFDIKTPPDKAKEPPSCKRLRPLRVLADNTLEHQPFLTADYDLLAIGFYCPKGSQSANPACKGMLTVNAESDEVACTPPTKKVSAYRANHRPPDPLPCLDPQQGLITEAQKSLLNALNAKIAQETGYESSNVSHHGPETQFFASPYVDYPITVFDPAGPDGKPAVVAIPKGPKGFRDIHLKRYYERKIREGYWLYPNTARTANWRWIARGTDADWRGWEYEDHPSLATGEDVEELTPPPCVAAAIERRKALLRGEEPPPLPPELMCRPEPGEAGAEAPEPQIEEEGERTGAKKPGGDEQGELAPLPGALRKPA